MKNLSGHSIHIEGGLLPADFLSRIEHQELPGQTEADFSLPKNIRLMDEIASAWSDARALWEMYNRRLNSLEENKSATSLTRNNWVIPLLTALGYQDISYHPRAEIIDGVSFAISHHMGEGDEKPPIHIEGAHTRLDERPPSGRPRLSPHSLMQEYLNRTEHLWGIVTNGLRLRILRDNALMTRPAYIEFDLQQIMDGERFADFILFYRLAHRTRFPVGMDDASDCLLEQYYQQAIEQGGRVRERLRYGVVQALQTFGNGFLAHPDNHELRQESPAPEVYYRYLLRLIYRLLFLMVSEERGLVGSDNE